MALVEVERHTLGNFAPTHNCIPFRYFTYFCMFLLCIFVCVYIRYLRMYLQIGQEKTLSTFLDPASSLKFFFNSRTRL